MADEPLDVRIACRIAAHEETDPMTLDPPLHEAVDVDALEALLQSPHDGIDFAGTVSFEYCGYTVTVEHTGAVSVAPSADGRPRGDPSGPAVVGTDR
ncbi:HalOD1 output domain-containing protein [Natrialbaceae archaeon A-gly3]